MIKVRISDIVKEIAKNDIPIGEVNLIPSVKFSKVIYVIYEERSLIEGCYNRTIERNLYQATFLNAESRGRIFIYQLDLDAGVYRFVDELKKK